MDETDASGEGRLRLVLAYLRATAADDREAVEVLTGSADLEELAEGLADVALLFIAAVSENPVRHIDLMFHALTVGDGQ